MSRGVKGELCIRGYNVMLCYWDDPEQTNKAIRQDGWYLTGYDQFYSGFITARLRVNYYFVIYHQLTEFIAPGSLL